VAHISEGLDLSSFDTITDEEINSNLMHVYSWRGGTYELGANALMLDYAPQFAKLHRWGSDLFGRPDPVNIVLLGIANQASYVMLGWETGIVNQTISLRRNGVPKEQIMELVMFAQLYAGMRGLGHTFRAVGAMLPALAEPTKPPAFPANWAPDPEAIKCGLDLSTLEVTAQDRANIISWYERNIGYLPKSIEIGLRYDPEFVKMNRAKWESAIRTLPKQAIPYVMLRLNMMSGSVQGLREAALLSRSWGISRKHVVRGITSSAMYFTSFEGLHTMYEAMDDILADWPDDDDAASSTPAEG
jgi:hypothetical protein